MSFFEKMLRKQQFYLEIKSLIFIKQRVKFSFYKHHTVIFVKNKP